MIYDLPNKETHLVYGGICLCHLLGCKIGVEEKESADKHETDTCEQWGCNTHGLALRWELIKDGQISDSGDCVRKIL